VDPCLGQKKHRLIKPWILIAIKPKSIETSIKNHIFRYIQIHIPMSLESCESLGKMLEIFERTWQVQDAMPRAAATRSFKLKAGFEQEGFTKPAKARTPNGRFLNVAEICRRP
jgi:hypothetical protein